MLFKVKITDIAINKKQLITVYIVDAEGKEEAEADCRRENPSAFSKAESVSVEEVGYSSIKFIAYHTPHQKPVNITPVLDKAKVSKLALEFANTLRIEIGPKDFAKMKKLNAKVNRDEKSVCHSHDFCDANMVMYAAFQKVTGRETCHEGNDVALWNAAWDEAFEKYLK